ncbi:MAG: VanZ family protein [Betaproteobacteria bacterium]|nr:VanZ family protein [Betaproteobacteria bacterium]
MLASPGMQRVAALGLLLTIGCYAYLGAQPVAAGLLGAHDKLGHLAAYGVFAALLWLAAEGRHPWRLFCALALLGAADECYQSLLPGRVADVADLAVDTTAGAVALFLLSRVPDPLRQRLFSTRPWSH